MLIGLVTNAVPNQVRWPGLLGWIQEHAWLSFCLLGVVLIGLSETLAVFADMRAPGGLVDPLLRENGDVVAPLGSAVVLRSLPRDASAFTDRREELWRLVTAVRTAQEQGGSLPVHVIDGMPAVGKTTFAVHVGHALKKLFPDGQLFVNLNGHTAGRSPVQASDALASLLTATGTPTQEIWVGDVAGAVTEARAGLWRSRLAGRKALLVLDNAASYGQFEALLPGSGGCLVLVTSRRRLAAHDEVVLAV
ncbi:hypothetical protein [Streptomyces anulatus]|uniref:hypothetical protein n=1 Tax=Streptomyces anulatus TaxID=1892 RepID=UPI00363FACC9